MSTDLEKIMAVSERLTRDNFIRKGNYMEFDRHKQYLAIKQSIKDFFYQNSTKFKHNLKFSKRLARHLPLG